jgi:hypothetical protein
MKKFGRITKTLNKLKGNHRKCVFKHTRIQLLSEKSEELYYRLLINLQIQK